MNDTQAFLERTSVDKTLQQELNHAVGGKDGEEALRAIIDLAQSHGFTVTMDEIARLASVPRENQELSDAELDEVAGGNNIFGNFLRQFGINYNFNVSGSNW